MKRFRLWSAVCALLVFSIFSSHANATLVYNVNRTIGAGTVTGFIKTDGTIGTLASANITDWTLTLTAPNLLGGSPDIIDFDSITQTTISGTPVTATATQLLFDFSASDGYLILQGTLVPKNFWCLEISGCSGDGFGEHIGFVSGGGGTAQSVTTHSGKIAFASVVPVPAAVWLFASGLVGLFGLARRRRVSA